MLARQSSDVDLDDLEEPPAAAPAAEPPGQKYRNIVGWAIAVAALVFIAAHGSASLRHIHAPAPSAPLLQQASARAQPAAKPPARRKPRPSASERERLEAKRLNDLKTQEIREAQEDPNSMFDMSNA